MPTLIGRTIVTVGAILIVATGVNVRVAVAAPNPEVAQQVIRQGIAKAIEILRSHHLPRKEITRRLRDAVRDDFDIAAIGKFALGRHHGRITKVQLEDYIDAFETLVVETYVSRIIVFGPRIKGNIDDIIEVTGAVRAGSNHIIANSRISRRHARWVRIDWHMHQQGGAAQDHRRRRPRDQPSTALPAGVHVGHTPPLQRHRWTDRGIA